MAKAVRVQAFGKEYRSMAALAKEHGILPGVLYQRMRKEGLSLEGAVLRPNRRQYHRSHPLYGTWNSMMTRCHNPKSKAYVRYGARGIHVCARWHNFKAFAEDMGMKPTPRHSIDRINSLGNYEPENCRWATSKEQVENTSICKPILGFPSVSEAARAIGMKQSTLARRIIAGWPPHLLTLPLGSRPLPRKNPRACHAPAPAVGGKV